MFPVIQPLSSYLYQVHDCDVAFVSFAGWLLAVYYQSTQKLQSRFVYHTLPSCQGFQSTR